MAVVWLVASAAVALQEPGEAELLLKRVERAMTANLAVRFTVNSELRQYQAIKPAGGRVTHRRASATVELMPGNRARIEGFFPVEGLDWPEPLPELQSPPGPEFDAAHMVIYSDGWTLSLSPLFKSSVIATAAPKKLNRSLLSDCLRLGVRPTVAETIKGLAADQKLPMDDKADSREPKISSWLAHPEATHLGREKLDGVETLKLQLKPGQGTGPASPTSTLWVDARTFLPLRRETFTKGADWERTVVESYTEFKSEVEN